MWKEGGGCGERMDVEGGWWMWRKGGCGGKVMVFWLQCPASNYQEDWFRSLMLVMLVILVMLLMFLMLIMLVMLVTLVILL